RCRKPTHLFTRPNWCSPVAYHQFTGSHKASQHRRCAATTITTEKRPVVAAHGPAAQRTFGVIVVDGEIRMLTVARQGGPVLQDVVRRLPRLTLGQKLFANLEQVDMELV